MYYGCFMVVLWLFCLKTGTKWVPNGFKMRRDEFDGIVFLKKHQMEFGFVKRGGSKNGGGIKCAAYYFTKIKLYFLISKKTIIFFISQTILFY